MTGDVEQLLRHQGVQVTAQRSIEATLVAFTDVILTETDASVTLVDRRGRPGGHWNDAYPFVRLHQPSAFYGVNSRKLGDDRKDTDGWTKIIDATYMHVTVPSMRPPPYEVADGMHCAPLNELPKITAPPDGYVGVGAGKTGADACLWLLANDVDPSAITWIMPRDSWYLDRAQIQPGDFFEVTAARFIEQFRHIAESTSIDDLFERLDQAGLLLRLDPNVRPTMYRCSTITKAELEQLRRIDNIVRIGRVQWIDADQIVLDAGTISTTPNTVHIDCTADGLERRPPVPVLDGNRVTLQTVRHCRQVFSAAFIAHAEATYDSDEAKNHLCGVVPHPDSDTDWIRTAHGNSLNSARWGADHELQRWLANARLDGFSSSHAPSEGLMTVMMGALQHAEPALAKLEQYVAGLDRLEGVG